MVGESRAHNRKTQLQLLLDWYNQGRVGQVGQMHICKDKEDGRRAGIYNRDGVLRMYVCIAFIDEDIIHM